MSDRNLGGISRKVWIPTYCCTRTFRCASAYQACVYEISSYLGSKVKGQSTDQISHNWHTIILIADNQQMAGVNYLLFVLISPNICFVARGNSCRKLPLE